MRNCSWSVTVSIAEVHITCVATFLIEEKDDWKSKCNTMNWQLWLRLDAVLPGHIQGEWSSQPVVVENFITKNVVGEQINAWQLEKGKYLGPISCGWEHERCKCLLHGTGCSSFTELGGEGERRYKMKRDWDHIVKHLLFF